MTCYAYIATVRTWIVYYASVVARSSQLFYLRRGYVCVLITSNKYGAMTLIVTLRTSDGIVIAGDSLSTMGSKMQIHTQFHVKCPSCGHEHDESAVLDGPTQPTTTLSYAQKVFPFMDHFGIGTFGMGQLAGKTMYFAMRELEQELKDKGTTVETITNAADLVGMRAHELLKSQMPDYKDIPDPQSVLGFMVVGYGKGEPKTIELNIGKTVKKTVHTDLGATINGEQRVAQAIWGLYKTNPLDQPAYNIFSLQDAIDYAEFLIRTTADHQKFSRTVATVGGKIDIALVTPFDGFCWIKRKPLTEIIDQRRAS